jgi:uncharacterized protein YjbI with pentapeptide repeats
MANPEHLQILQQGVEAWNAWRAQHRDIRPDLWGSDLSHANLAMADLSGADLHGAFLDETKLALANLTGADLSEANLSHANLALANLTGANLTGANLTGADLSGVNLTRADLSEVRLNETVFGDTNLTAVRGLETCVHHGPSILDHSTLAQSGYPLKAGHSIASSTYRQSLVTLTRSWQVIDF